MGKQIYTYIYIYCRLPEICFNFGRVWKKRHICTDIDIILHEMTSFTVSKWVWRSPAATCLLVCIRLLLSFYTHSAGWRKHFSCLLHPFSIIKKIILCPCDLPAFLCFHGILGLLRGLEVPVFRKKSRNRKTRRNESKDCKRFNKHHAAEQEQVTESSCAI